MKLVPHRLRSKHLSRVDAESQHCVLVVERPDGTVREAIVSGHCWLEITEVGQVVLLEPEVR